jgi:hypothetical protein
MGFGTGKFSKIWSLEDKGNYHIAEMSTSKKNKDTDQYETDWSNKFVRLVGNAHSQAKSLDISKSVKIGSCEVTNHYDKEKSKEYTNYVIFGFEDTDSNVSNSKPQTKATKEPKEPDGDIDDLPF